MTYKFYTYYSIVVQQNYLKIKTTGHDFSIKKYAPFRLILVWRTKIFLMRKVLIILDSLAIYN